MNQPYGAAHRFKNDPCYAGTKNGTCYTASECEQRAGVNAGSCAQGYGVCCTCEKIAFFYLTERLGIMN